MTRMGREHEVARRRDGGSNGDGARPDLTIIVPVTENPQALDELYDEFRAVFDEHGETAEFLFVAEVWGTDTLAPIQALAEWGHPIRVFEAGERAGESNLLLVAREHARGELLVTLPAYRRIEPSELLKLVESVRGGAALATAVRIQKRDHLLNRIQHWGFHILLHGFVGTRFRDLASGVRVMRPEVLDEVPLYGDAFRFLPLLASREAFVVEEVEVTQHGRDQRAKLYSPGTYLRRLIDLLGMAFLSRFTHKPLRFFGLVGTILALIGGVMLAVTAFQRFAGDTPLANRPALVLAVLAVVLGVQSIALGLIGEIIVHFSVGDRATYRLERPIVVPEETPIRASGPTPERAVEERDGDETNGERDPGTDRSAAPTA
ncbi:MAG: hypothetical protein MJB57_02775 [Gemmatimonadetes bacterium]|nr:hypothetical protein [Gemmatimonadota bacterium]